MTEPKMNVTGVMRSSTAKRAAALLVALILGGALSFILKWDGSPEYADISALSIFCHNLAISTALVLLGPYVAASFLTINAAYLGFAVIGSVKTVGILATTSLTVVHVPLEITAWLMSWSAANRFWIWIKDANKSKSVYGNCSENRQALLSLFRLYLQIALTLAIAAFAEWCELQIFLFFTKGDFS